VKTIIFICLACLILSCEKCYVCVHTLETDWNTDDPVSDAMLSSKIETESDECFTKSEMEDYEAANTWSQTTNLIGGSATVSGKAECTRDFLGKYK